MDTSQSQREGSDWQGHTLPLILLIVPFSVLFFLGTLGVLFYLAVSHGLD